MQRAVYALVAILSLFAANLRPTQAQSSSDSPVTPQTTPTNIDDVIKVGSTPGRAENLPVSDYVLSADQSVDNLYQRDRRVVLAGHVQHDVMVVNCDVIVKPGATVGGHIDAVGGSVDNQAGDAVRVIQQDSGLIAEMGGALAPSAPSEPATSRPLRRGEWPGSQFYLAVVGLLGGLILFVMAPRATQRTSDIVAIERPRSMVLGIIGACIIGFVMLCGSVLLKSPLSVLAAPFVAGIDVVCAVILGFGWLCGMAHVGEFLQNRLRGRAGSWYAQMAWGLLAFCLINMVLGVISPFLGGIAVFFEALFALMGLGAALISGFGADTNWLSMRMRREGSWFSRSTRL
jgi:hypothetical protein